MSNVDFSGKLSLRKHSRFTETQIVAILKEVDGGITVNEICRNHGISDATYYN